MILAWELTGFAMKVGQRDKDFSGRGSGVSGALWDFL